MSVRIVVASPTPHDQQETFVKAHVDRLERVVTTIVNGSLPRHNAQGVPLIEDTLWRRWSLRIKGMTGPVDRKELLQDRIAGLLRETKAQVVLAEYGTCAHALIGPCRTAGVPLVAHFHGYDAYSAESLKATGGYARLFNEAAAIVAVSSAMRAHLIALGARQEQVLYNSCGVDMQRFSMGDPRVAPPHFVAVGRFVEKKAPQRVIEAMAKVVRQRPEARLTMVGDGPLLNACVEQVRALGLEERIHLTGALDNTEVAALMRRSRAFVQHSVIAANGDREGTPVAVLEAMASGLPVVATSHMGIADAVVHGTTGLFCNEHDVDAMADHMISMIDDPALAARMGEAGRERAADLFSMERSIQRLQDLLAKVATRS